MRKVKVKYIVYYKKSQMDEWQPKGMYSRTVAICTANAFLREEYLVKIYPVRQGD